MFATIINKINNSLKISSPTSNNNPKTTTLDTVAKKKNLNYISKFGLSANFTYHINLRLIFHDIYIDNLITALDVILNL